MKRLNVKTYRIAALILFFFMTLFFAWTFAEAPFSEFVNSLILNGGTMFSALIAAIIFSVLPLYYERGEPPRTIWTFFAICIWLWTIAEAIWGYLYVRDGEVPVFSVADVFWLVGYMALTVSLARQFRLVSFSKRSSVIGAATGIWVGVLGIIAVILFITHSETPLADFFSYYYLLADTCVGLLALYFVYAFRARALAIPWLTISSFVFSDFLYIQLTTSGVYDYVMSGISIALLADTLYVVAYLLVAWGGLEQYLLLRSNADHSQD
jgi:hypothetical protein